MTFNESNYHIYPTPPLGQDMTQGQFFKQSLTGLNSEFSFSKTSCLTKAEEPSLALLFTHSWRENNWIYTFLKGISAMWNAICPGFELVSPCPIPATITITPLRVIIEKRNDTITTHIEITRRKKLWSSGILFQKQLDNIYKCVMHKSKMPFCQPGLWIHRLQLYKGARPSSRVSSNDTKLYLMLRLQFCVELFRNYLY